MYPLAEKCNPLKNEKCNPFVEGSLLCDENNCFLIRIFLSSMSISIFFKSKPKSDKVATKQTKQNIRPFFCKK